MADWNKLVTAFNTISTMSNRSDISQNRSDISQNRSDISRVNRNLAAVKKVGADLKEVGANVKEVGAAVKKVGADLKEVGANVKEVGADVKEVGADLKEMDAKVAELLEKDRKREEREELERQRAELDSQRQQLIKNAVFEIKQELDDLEKEEDRVAVIFILSVLQSEIENVDLSLDEFDSLIDREYVIQVIKRLDNMGAETASALTDTEQKQLVALDDALGLIGKKAEHVLKIEEGIADLEARLSKLSQSIDQPKDDQKKGLAWWLWVVLCGSVFYSLIGGPFILYLIGGWVFWWVFRRRRKKLQEEEDRKQRNEILHQIQDHQSNLDTAIEEQKLAEQRLFSIIKNHPALGFLVEKP